MTDWFEDFGRRRKGVRARIRDIAVFYEATGRGESVVFVHGLAEDHRWWAPHQRALGTYRTFAYDVRGHGKTALGEAQGTLAQLGDDLVAFLEMVSGPAACVGFSMGGTIVLWAASHRKDLIRGAVVIGTSSAVGRAAATFYRERIAVVEERGPAGIADLLYEDTRAGLVSDRVDFESLTAARLQAVGEGGGYRNGLLAMSRMRERPLQPTLRNVECPVLVISGERDVFCPRRAADIMLENLPFARHVELPGVGHLMTVEDPHAVADAILTFLSEGKAVPGN